MECRKERGGSAGSHLLTSSSLSSLSPLFALPHRCASLPDLIVWAHRPTSSPDLIARPHIMSSSPNFITWAHRPQLISMVPLPSAPLHLSPPLAPLHGIITHSHHPQLLPVASSPMRLSLFLIASPHRTWGSLFIHHVLVWIMSDTFSSQSKLPLRYYVENNEHFFSRNHTSSWKWLTWTQKVFDKKWFLSFHRPTTQKTATSCKLTIFPKKIVQIA